MDPRLMALQAWACDELALDPDAATLVPVSDDASFRRYFRFAGIETGFVMVDAPPDKEANGPFVDIAGRLGDSGVRVPTVRAWDRDRGFIIVSDLGNQLLLPLLPTAQRARLYRAAITTLGAVKAAPVAGLPAYDAGRLRDEMALFRDWFLARQISLAESPAVTRMLDEVFDQLVSEALAQPTVFVHRDYHSRNLMLQADDAIGVIDFQDAVSGPLTYDLVSLLRDCYFELAPIELDELVEHGRLALAPDVSAGTFRRWFDWMGMQRHLKCAGIFSRLNLRDGKPRYLGDIPLILRYLEAVAGVYPEFAAFREWLVGEVIPRYQAP